jgi:hypothetical protein
LTTPRQRGGVRIPDATGTCSRTTRSPNERQLHRAYRPSQSVSGTVTGTPLAFPRRRSRWWPQTAGCGTRRS